MQQTIVESYLKKIQQSIFEKGEPVGGWKYRTAEFVKPQQYKWLSDWKELDQDHLFSVDETVFMETTCKVPDPMNDSQQFKDYLCLKFKNFEGLVYINDKPYHGVDRNRDLIPFQKEMAGSTIKIKIELCSVYLFDAFPEKPMFLESGWVTVNKQVEKYYYDLKLAWESIAFIDNEYCRIRVMDAIDDSLQYLDLSLQGDAYTQKVIEADRKLMEALHQIGNDQLNGVISLIGHTHIDIAWLWPLKDTVRKASRTFSNIIRLMEEFPQFKFTCSQPQLYDFLRVNYPDIYTEVKRLAAEGRIEILGPMWVESDCNLVSGESLVRQLLYGHEFFRQEFNLESNICWLPDTFGFQANMPQILKKGGVDYFFSYKLHWQSENRFPYGVFKWKGIDGTEMISSIPNLKEGYNGYPSPEQMKFAQNENLQKELSDEVMATYGWGDGGGGPDRNMIEYASRLKDFPGLPSCNLEYAADHFERLEKMSSKLPVWYGELYHESHRGTYTSVGRVKKMNRVCEQLFRQLEIINVLAEIYGKHTDWEDVQNNWKDILTLQFHDILPGSSIAEVYTDADEMYERIVRKGHELLTAGLQYLADCIRNKNENVITVFNALSWTRNDKVKVALQRELQNVERMVLLDENQNQVEFVLSESENGEKSIEFVAEKVPSIGFKHYTIRSGDAAAVQSPAITSTDKDGITVENQYFVLRIQSDGTLARLFDKSNHREVLGDEGRANEFRLFLDGPQIEDAWNIYHEYKNRKLDVKWENHISVTENNAVRTVVRLTKKQEKASICQDIILYNKLDKIDFVTTVDWKEMYKVLKVSFPVEVLSPTAAYEIGFGAIERPTYANTPYEKSKFEVYGHRWVDLSEEGYGVSVLNDSKYGHDIQDNVISITLLRGTNCPGLECDKGIHEFTYSLYPHRDHWRKAMTVRRGAELNSPLAASVGLSGNQDKIGSHEDAAAHLYKPISYFGIDNPHVVLDTIKPAQDGNGMIVRFYESSGSRGDVHVQTMFELASLFECNLIEVNESKVNVDNRTFSFPIKPFEVKTFRLILEEQAK